MNSRSAAFILAGHRSRPCVVLAVALLGPLGLRAQLPVPTPPPQQPPPAPAPQPVTRLPAGNVTPALPPMPVRPGEMMMEGKLECGPPPVGWPGLLGRPRGTTPSEVRLTPTGPRSAELTWMGAPWATRHEVVDLDNVGGGVPGRCYVEWGLPLPEPLPPSGRVGPVVVREAPQPMLEAAPRAPAPPLVAMREMVPRPWGCYAATYRYRVVAHYPDSAPAWSEVVSFTTPAGPPVPSFGQLTAEGMTLGADLRWGALAEAIEYRIYRNNALVGTRARTIDPLSKRSMPPDTTYSDQVPAAGLNTYRVEALLSRCDYAPGPSGEALAVSQSVTAIAKSPPPPRPLWCRRKPS